MEEEKTQTKVGTPPLKDSDMRSSNNRKQSPGTSTKNSYSSNGSSKKSSPDTSTKTEHVASSKSGSTTSAADSTTSLCEIANENESNDLLFGSNGQQAVSLNPQRVISTKDTIPPIDRIHQALDEEKLCEHLEKYLLANDNKARTFVYSSTLGGTNVYCFAPSVQLKRDYWTLVTMGMSGTAMKVPTDITDGHLYAHAEVMCYLPADWKFPQALGGKVDAQNWPVEMLRSLARYVNTTGAWLAEDHGVPNLLSDPPGLPFTQQTKLSHMILLAPVNEDEDFSSVEVGNTRVNFYLVIPITAAEATWKREMGAEKSIYYVVGSQKEAGDDVFIDYIIDPTRPCTVDDLNCREIFDNQSIGDDEDDEQDAYGEFEDLDTEDSNEQITSEENNSGETEQCSDSSDVPAESSEDSIEVNQHKRVKRE